MHYQYYYYYYYYLIDRLPVVSASPRFNINDCSTGQEVIFAGIRNIVVDVWIGSIVMPDFRDCLFLGLCNHLRAFIVKSILGRYFIGIPVEQILDIGYIIETGTKV